MTKLFWHLASLPNGLLFNHSDCILILSLFGLELKLFFPELFFSVLDVHLSFLVVGLDLLLSGLVFLDEFELFC